MSAKKPLPEKVCIELDPQTLNVLVALRDIAAKSKAAGDSWTVIQQLSVYHHVRDGEHKAGERFLKLWNQQFPESEFEMPELHDVSEYDENGKLKETK